jgi:hypothetical protein
MRNNHGSLEPPLKFTEPIYTIDALFERAFIEFKASISFRDTMTTLNNKAHEFYNFTTQILEDCEDERRRRRQSQSDAGNKRNKHTAHMKTITGPRKRAKAQNKRSAKAPQKTITKKDPPSISEEYRFIVRNTTFPNPKNCMNFMQKQTGEKNLRWVH